MADQLVTGRVALGAALIAYLNSGTPAVSASLKIMLFTNDAPADPATTLASLTPPDYTGYGAQATIVLGGNAYNASDDAFIECEARAFQPADGVSPNTIRGWALYADLPTDVLLTLFKYDEPVPLVDNGDVLIVQPRIMFGQPLDGLRHV